MSEKIWKQENYIEIELELPLKKKRIASRKLGEKLNNEEINHTPEESFKINTFFSTMDVVILYME